MNEDTRISNEDWTPRRRAIFRLALSKGVGPCRYAQLLQKFETPEAAVVGLIDMRRRDVQVASERDVDRAIAAAAAADAHILLSGDDAYPRRLREIGRPPMNLYWRGELARIDGRTVGIVGARNASGAARRFAEELARDLSSMGVNIVSGLARGIDGAAHRGSLDGFPIGVVAAGIDVVYPREHADLQRAIVENGVLLAESHIGATPTERHFPRRNRIVAGLAEAVVVIEAAERSGSLITARFAMEENREVMAAPGFPTDPRSAGANRLIRDGALLVRNADDVVAGLPVAEAPRRKKRSTKRAAIPAEDITPSAEDAPSAPADEAAVADIDKVRGALAAAPITVDELSRECQLPASVVAAILLDLELGGELERLPGQRVALS